MSIPLKKNTITNYLNVAVRMLQGVFITRWILSDLGPESYGMWSILWSFFCYSLLFDFGFGVAAQKSTSQKLWQSDIKKYNKIISTVFSFYLVMGLIIALCTVAASFFTVELFNLQNASAESVNYYRYALLLFGIGASIAFPFGLAGEILAGLQLNYLKNYVIIAFKTIELLAILLIFSLGGGLIQLIILTLSFIIVSNAFMLFLVKKHLPEMQIRIHSDRATFKEIFKFSSFIYLISMARLFLDRGVIFFISIFSGLTAVGIFQIGGKVPSLMGCVTNPYQENIGPMVALFYERKRKKYLQQLFVNTLRYNSFLCTGMSVAIFILGEAMIDFLFDFQSAEATKISKIVTITAWLSTIYRVIPEKFLIMANKHKVLSMTALFEAIVLSITILLLLGVYHCDIYAVVLAILIIKALTTFLIVLPISLKHIGLSYYGIIKNTTLSVMLPAVFAGSFFYYLLTLQSSIQSNFLFLMYAALGGSSIYCLTSYFTVMPKAVRKKYWAKLMMR